MASLSAKPRSYGKAPLSLTKHPADGSTPQRSWRDPGDIPTAGDVSLKGWVGDLFSKILLLAHVFLLSM